MFAPVIAPWSSQLMYVSCDMGGVYRSSDSGNTWQMLDTRDVYKSQQFNDAANLADFAFTIAIDPKSSAASGGSGVHVVGALELKDSSGNHVWTVRESQSAGDRGSWADYPVQIPGSITVGGHLATTEQITAAIFDANGRLLVGTTNALYVANVNASGAPIGFDRVTTTSFVRNIVAVTDPATGQPAVFVGLQNDVLQLSGSSPSFTLTSIVGGLPTPPTGIRVRDLAGGSDASHYVLYATVPGWLTTDATGRHVNGGVYRLTKTSTTTTAWTRETGLVYAWCDPANQTDGPPFCSAPSADASFQDYRYLAVVDGNPDLAYVSVFNNRFYPNAFRRASSGAWTQIYSGFQNGANDYTPGWINVLEPAPFMGWGFAGDARGLAVSKADSNTVVWVNNAAVDVTHDGGGNGSFTAGGGPNTPKDWAEKYSQFHHCSNTASNNCTNAGEISFWKTTGLDNTTAWNYFIHPSSSSIRFIAATDYGLARSADSGTSWQEISYETTASGSLSTNPHWTNFYDLAFEGGASGRIWAAVSTQHDIPRVKPDVLSNAPGHGAVLVSTATEAGTVWRRPAACASGGTLPDLPVVSLAYDAANTILYAALWGGASATSTDGGVYKSTGSTIGSCWSAITATSGFPTRHFYQLHLKGSQLYLSVSGANQGTSFIGGGLYTYAGSGTSWSAVGSTGFGKRMPADFTFDPSNSSIIYVATESVSGSDGGGVLQLNPNTNAWSLLSSLPLSSGVEVFGVSFVSNTLGVSSMYVSSSEGLWYASGAAGPWNEIKAAPFKSPQRLTPDGSNKVFVSTFGGGVELVDIPTYTIALDTTAPHDATTIHATYTPINNFAGTVTPTASGFPVGSHVTFTPSSITFSANSGPQTVSVQLDPGTATSQTKTVSIGVDSLHNASFDWTISAASISVAATDATDSNASTVTVTEVNGFAGNVTLTFSGLPTGGTASFAVNPVAVTATTPGSTSLNLTPGTAMAGTYTVTVTGTSGTITKSATFQWTISPVFSLSADSTSLTDTQSTTVHIASVNVTGPLTVSATGPSGSTVTLKQGAAVVTSVTLSRGTTTDVTLSAVPGTAASGSRSINFTGGSQTLSLNWTINPVYTAAAAPTSLTDTQSTTITISSVNFTGSISVGASGPNGSSVAIAGGVTSANLTAGHSTTVTINAAPGTAAAGAQSITATLGTVSLSIPWTISPVYVVTSSPSSLTDSATSTISVSSPNFTGQVAVSASGAPSGSTVSLSASTVGVTAGAAPTTLTLTATPGTAAAGANNITVTAGTKTTSLNWTISPVYTVTANPANITDAQSTTITVNSTNFTGALSLSAVGPPGGNLTIPASVNVTAGTPAPVTLSADPNTAAIGAQTITVTAGTKSTTVGWTISANYTVAVSPVSLTDGGSATVTVHSLNYTGSISLSASGPSGGSVSIPASLSLTAGQDSTATLTVAAGTAAAGSQTVNVTVGTKALNVPWTISPVYSVAASPASFTDGGSSTITVTSTNFTGSIPISAQAPTGATVTLSAATLSLTAGSPTTATLNATVGNAAGGSQTITITAGTHTTSIAWTITPHADFAVAASPASVAGTTSTQISVTSSGGFSAAVSLALAGAPSGSGATLSASSVNVTPTTPGTATLTLSPGTASNGTYPLTLTAGGTHVITVVWRIGRVVTPPVPPIFADAFDRTTGLGSEWTTWFGGFTTDGAAATSGAPAPQGNWASVATALRTNDYAVSADMIIPSASTQAALVARGSATSFDQDNYSARLSTDGSIYLSRRNAGTVTVLGSNAAGITANVRHNLRLTVSGSSPVHLEVWLDGTVRLEVDDAAASRLTSGAPGLGNFESGVAYSAFSVTPAPLFHDNFTRSSGLGSNWTMWSGGSYTTDGTAAIAGTPPVGGDWAQVVPALGGNDYVVQANIVLSPGAAATGVVARGDPTAFDGNCYALQLATDGNAYLYRRNNWSWTALGSAAVGITANVSHTVWLVVTGAAPVHLEGWVDGVKQIVVDDASTSSLKTGLAGMQSYDAGSKFSAFAVQRAAMFADTFNRTIGLGNGWTPWYGSYTTNGTNAVSGAAPTQGNWAAVTGQLASNDYAVQADITVPTGSLDSGVAVRSSVSGAFDSDVYATKIGSDGTIRLYRRNSWNWTLLTSANAGVQAGTIYTVKMVATGSTMVHLEAWLDGKKWLTYDDSSASKLNGGGVGMVNYDAGVTYTNLMVFAQ